MLSLEEELIPNVKEGPTGPRLELLPWQSDFILNPSRHKVAVAGRRSAKTTMQAVDMALMAQARTTNQWFLALTHGQAEELMWKMLFERVKLPGNVILPPLIPPGMVKKLNKGSGRLGADLVNGSTMSLRGVENWEALLGQSLDKVRLDEFQSMDPGIIPIVFPMLMDNMGGSVITGTARGFNHMYDRYMMGQAGTSHKAGWYSVRIPTTEAGSIKQSEIEQMKFDMSAVEFQQEVMCVFTLAEGRVYYTFDRKRHHRTLLDFSKDVLHIGIDFNNNGMSAVVCVIRTENGKPVVYVVNELMGALNTPALIKDIKEAYGNRRILVYPDASGQYVRSTTSADTDHAQLRNAGFTVITTNSNYPGSVKDRINTVNGMLLSAADTVRCYINTSTCKYLTMSLETQCYDQSSKPEKGRRLGNTNIEISGPVDAFGYFMLREFKLKNTQTAPVVMSGF